MNSTNPYYDCKDIQLITGMSENYCYKLIKKLGLEISKTRVPGKEFNYLKPPAGKIYKEYFADKIGYSVEKCDEMLCANSLGKAV